MRLASLPICRFALALLVALLLAAGPGAGQGRLPVPGEAVPAAVPDAVIAAEMFGHPGPLVLTRREGDLPAWLVTGPDGAPVGAIGSTWEIARTVGYSGRPIDMLVAVTPEARISAARLMRQSEPILTLGLSEADIARFVGSFAGIDLAASGAGVAEDQVDVISRATVSTGVIRDAILRVGRLLAIEGGALDGGRIERLDYAPATWAELEAAGAIAHARVTMTEAAEGLAGAAAPPEPGDGTFLEFWVALADPPTIGRNILGRQAHDRALAALAPGEALLFIGSRGLHSHRGLDWRRRGVFDRIALIQDGQRFPLTRDGYTRIDKLAAEDAPEMKERSLFRAGGDGFDPARSFRVEIAASRPAAEGGEVKFAAGLDYTLPETYLRAPPPAPEPLWRKTWREKRLAVAGLGVMLAVLTAILFLQGSLVRRPWLWRRVRLSYLAVTFLGLGWMVNGQLSVVQVVAFLQSLLSGFRWETFLIDPIIFILWSFVALGLLFWGRGVYCGWLCPFGALQELTNAIARKLGVKQIAVPHALHERLWVIKYTLFLGILALSFYSMKDALILAEVEPFKTAISLRMIRAWPFVLFVLVLLAAGLFIERFYCRYLCPLGAALAIPAKLKIFDWLRRRPQCGRECRLCEPKCTVGAIDPLGRINPNECVLCLRCQVIYNDPNTCPTLKRRARAAAAAGGGT